MACTDRLCLRLLRPDDASHLEQVVEPGWVAAMMARSGDRALSPWAIVLRDGGAVVGHCGFLVRPVKGTTMGYAIVPRYRGRGLATEAAAAVLDWAERHEIDVYASVRPPNPASVRVLEKIGMRLVDSYVDEDGQRDIYRPASTAQGQDSSTPEILTPANDPVEGRTGRPSQRP
jgi:RimJ/RimL family protein N-acetyltransferase